MEQLVQAIAEEHPKEDFGRLEIHFVKGDFILATRKRKAVGRPRERANLALKTKVIVLTEAGYRCAVPTCRTILALDMHHIWEVSAGGGDEPSNLIALCSFCHDLYHRGTISSDSIYVYKAMLVAITRAFDLEAIDRLLSLESCS